MVQKTSGGAAQKSTIKTFLIEPSKTCRLPTKPQIRFVVDIEHFTVASEPPTPKGEYSLRKSKIRFFMQKAKILGIRKMYSPLGAGLLSSKIIRFEDEQPQKFIDFVGEKGERVFDGFISSQTD